MNNISVSQLFKPLIAILRRFSFTFFIVLVAGSLALAVLMLNDILVQSSDTSGYTSTLGVTSFDQTTIDQLTNLTTSNKSAGAINLPAGRINPFSE